MASASTKQQVIQKIKDHTNILVTVSRDPDVDELSAALGLTLFLNALGKHATAVFSGKVPPAISFLEPDKTFEDTADSLRDFIIALDKEKADHLRYKVVDDAVKIFITPYKTTISEADLEFSQGDYNVELVLALNVENNDHLDEALSAHGKILHSADVVTITAQGVKSNLGTTDWHDKGASGVSEMLLELVGALKTPKVTLDEQIATAFLTGIVAVTERFSNSLTSSRVMTAAAELMAAGANQQLIAVKLTEAGDLPDATVASDDRADGALAKSGDDEPEDATRLSIDRSEKAAPRSGNEADDVPATSDEGALTVTRQRAVGVDEVARQTQIDAQDEAARAAEAHLNKLESMAAPEVVPEPVINGMPTAPLGDVPAVAPAVVPLSSDAAPVMGGTLNATTEQAAEDKRREEAADKNKVILSHGGYVGASQPALGDAPMNAAMAPPTDEPPAVDLFAQPPAMPSTAPVIAPLGETPPPDPLMDALAEETRMLAEQQPMPESQSAREAVDAALAATPPADPFVQPGVMPPLPPAPTLAEIEQTAQQGLPPLPDFSTLPDLPPAFPTAPAQPVTEPSPQPAFNPAQFQIPGQQ
ncbi:MAG: hypothetical protein Q4A34_03195 [Candidatus Saccharibacteria bacterium]|nr:hypothetical protein [Candidatus Saccharibacteria bacterium]